MVEMWNKKLESAKDIFRARLNMNITTKVPSSKRLYWVCKLSFDNLERVLSIMIIMNHLQPRLQVNNEVVLLNDKVHYGKLETENIGEREGCYLYQKKKAIFLFAVKNFQMQKK